MNVKHISRFQGSYLAHILNSESGVDSSHITHRESNLSLQSTTSLDRRDTSANINSQTLTGTGQGDPSLPRAYCTQPPPTPTIGHNREVSNRNCQVAYTVPPPRPQKTEKLKMLDGEPFLPYVSQMVDERTKCAFLVHSINITSSANSRMSGAAQAYFKDIIDTRCIRPRYE
jgi:hypothetical protein